MKVERLIKSHWKKVLLSVYVVAVLVISANVKAQTVHSAELRNELRQVSAEISFLQDRKMLETESLDLTSGSLNASGQSLVGYFDIATQEFGEMVKVYFVAIPSKAHFEVDVSSLNNNLDSIEKNQLYQVEGFVVKQSLPTKPQIVPNLIVTSIKTQR